LFLSLRNGDGAVAKSTAASGGVPMSKPTPANAPARRKRRPVARADACAFAPGALETRTGAGVRIALIDSGINPGHSHVGPIAGGVAFNASSEGEVLQTPDYRDTLGTARRSRESSGSRRPRRRCSR